MQAQQSTTTNHLVAQAFIVGYHEGVKKGEQRVHEAAEQMLKEQLREKKDANTTRQN